MGIFCSKQRDREGESAALDKRKWEKFERKLSQRLIEHLAEDYFAELVYDIFDQ